MCLSLIQENVGLYSSYFIEKEEEDVELDIIIPQKRIPNWSERMDALLNDEGDHLSMGENGVNVQEVNIPGMVEIDSDSKSNTSSSDAESSDEVSSNSNEGEISNDDDENESTNSTTDSDSEDSSEKSDYENDKPQSTHN